MSDRVVVDDDGVRALVRGVPDDAELVPDTQVNAIDVSKLPGARLVARDTRRSEALSVDVGCVRGPSDRYAPGIEGTLFEKATHLAVRTGALAPDELAVSATRTEPPVLGQVLLGKSGAKAIRIEHALAFVGEDSDVLLCTITCAGDDAACSATSLVIEGALAAPPTPSAAVRLALAAGESPGAALAILAAISLAVVSVVLARRPRPRRRRPARL